jgi:PleD family two-component response regulator
VADNKPKILIVEDDLDVADMLNAYFRVQGYDAHAVNWGEDGFRAAQTTDPDLIILDIRLPDIDGFEVAQRLRTTRKTQGIPIIFLTEKRDRTDRLHGLELGADDYITKPFDVQELRLRVRNALKRASQDTLTNPVTGLPDGSLVEEKLRECVQHDGWAILLVSLINVDKFREAYGFVASDDVMRAVSLMIHNAMRDAGAAEGFLGHFSPYDFVLLALPGMVPNLEERIRSRLEQSLDYFYPLRDRDQQNSRADRLKVKVSRLIAGECQIASLEDLKTELLNRKSKP